MLSINKELNKNSKISHVFCWEKTKEMAIFTV